MIPRQHRVSTLWASLLLMCALPASAAVVSDDFNDNDLNEGLFTLGTLGTGPELEEREQRLEVRLPATSSGEDFFYGVTTRPLFRGDLDAQVDFQMLDYPPANGVRLGIIIQGPEGGPTALQRTSFSERELSAGPREGYLLHSGDELEQHPSEDLAGKLRLTRVGTTVTGYFWDAATEAWVPFASLPGTDTNVHISLAVWSHDRAFADQDVRVAFDNFVVNSGQVVGAVLPDLAGRWLQAQGRGRGRGENRQSSVRGLFAVQNTGEAMAEPSVVRFFLSTDESLSPDDLLLREETLPALPPGGRQLVRLRQALPRGVPTRGRFLIAVVDATSAVSEANEFGQAVARGPLR